MEIAVHLVVVRRVNDRPNVQSQSFLSTILVQQACISKIVGKHGHLDVLVSQVVNNIQMETVWNLLRLTLQIPYTLVAHIAYYNLYFYYV